MTSELSEAYAAAMFAQQVSPPRGGICTARRSEPKVGTSRQLRSLCQALRFPVCSSSW
nr:hypothetical protein [Streptomyces gougerotii]